MRHVVVELETGEQEFFSHAYDGFKFAKEQENKKRNSVDYVAIGDFYEEDGVVYRGQKLRNTLRMLDDIDKWFKAQVDEDVYDLDSREDYRSMD